MKRALLMVVVLAVVGCGGGDGSADEAWPPQILPRGCEAQSTELPIRVACDHGSADAVVFCDGLCPSGYPLAVDESATTCACPNGY